jgi:hypothetical protein
MMTSNRKFEILAEGYQFPIKSGDAFDISFYFQERYVKQIISRSTMYKMKPGQIREVKAIFEGKRLKLKCLK